MQGAQAAPTTMAMPKCREATHIRSESSQDDTYIKVDRYTLDTISNGVADTAMTVAAKNPNAGDRAIPNNLGIP